MVNNPSSGTLISSEYLGTNRVLGLEINSKPGNKVLVHTFSPAFLSTYCPGGLSSCSASLKLWFHIDHHRCHGLYPAVKLSPTTEQGRYRQSAPAAFSLGARWMHPSHRDFMDHCICSIHPPGISGQVLRNAHSGTVSCTASSDSALQPD